MNNLYELRRRLFMYDDINKQKWFIEAREGCSESKRDGNNILIYFNDVDLAKKSLEKLNNRNISNSMISRIDNTAVVFVSYNFKERKPRRDMHAKGKLILD